MNFPIYCKWTTWVFKMTAAIPFGWLKSFFCNKEEWFFENLFLATPVKLMIYWLPFIFTKEESYEGVQLYFHLPIKLSGAILRTRVWHHSVKSPNICKTQINMAEKSCLFNLNEREIQRILRVKLDLLAVPSNYTHESYI